MLTEGLFFEIGAVLVIAAIFSLLVYRLKQPLILAYIVTGIVVGPGVLAIAQSQSFFDVLSQVGIAFLLFTVGLGLNWRTFKDVGGIALATGVGQVLFTSLIGFGIGLVLGFNIVSSVYLSVAFAFSSTIIIVKMLMDKEDIDTLYGRISVGFLLVQDFIAMLVLLGLSAVTRGATLSQALITVIIKAVILIPVFWFISTRVLPSLLRYVARSQEMLFIFAIAWCFLIAGVLVRFGFGIEIGALIAGITLSGSVFQREINARIRPLRDFFLIIFFIVLGTHLGFDHIRTLFLPVIVFSLFVLICNPLIVMIIMRLLGYHPRTGLLAGTTVAQISEFSFILIAAGIAAGHITQDLLTIATAVGLITIAVSSFLIHRNQQIYDRCSVLFKWMEPEHTLEEEEEKIYQPVHTLLFGYHPIGSVLLETIKTLKQSYLIVDFDPQMIRKLAELGEPHVYGDVADEAFLEQIQVQKAHLVLSTIPDVVVSTALLTYLKTKKFGGLIVVSVHTNEEAKLCYELGAAYVIIPNFLSGKKFSELLKDNRASKRAWESTQKKFVPKTA